MADLDVYRLTLTFTVAHQFAQTTCHYLIDESEGVNPGLRAQQIAAEFPLAFSHDLMQVLAQNVRWFSCAAVRINNGRGPIGRHPIPINAGDRPSNCDMPQTSAVIQFSGRGANRWVRGRMFLPGIPSADVDEGIISNALFTELLDLGDALRTQTLNVDGRNWNFVIWSELEEAFIPPISNDVASVIGTQRGRQRPAL